MARLKLTEEEESWKTVVEIKDAVCPVALDLCETLAFTIANTRGTEEIHPARWPCVGKRQENLLPTQDLTDTMVNEEIIKLDAGPGRDHRPSNYNHKVRRKLHRALDNAHVQKEVLARQRAVDLQKNEIQPPVELKIDGKPVNVRGVLQDEAVETAKQKRARARLGRT
ncbi:MAG: hypothetical protein Q9216_001688 [Gyalolechia sp. 2 TL-2023]